MKYLSFRSWCHRRAKVIQVPNIDFRLVSTRRNKICLEDTFLIFFNHPPQKIRKCRHCITNTFHLPEMGWCPELSLVLCACHSQQWSRHSLQPWSSLDHTGWRCRSRLRQWGRQMVDCLHPLHKDPRPVCGICGEIPQNAYDEQAHSKERVNKRSVLSSLGDLWEEEKLPHDFMSRDGSLKSSSKNSRDALVLKEASSCWAEVPAEVNDKTL